MAVVSASAEAQTAMRSRLLGSQDGEGAEGLPAPRPAGLSGQHCATPSTTPDTPLH